MAELPNYCKRFELVSPRVAARASVYCASVYAPPVYFDDPKAQGSALKCVQRTARLRYDI